MGISLETPKNWVEFSLDDFCISRIDWAHATQCITRQQQRTLLGSSLRFAVERPPVFGQHTVRAASWIRLGTSGIVSTAPQQALSCLAPFYPSTSGADHLLCEGRCRSGGV